MPTQGKKTRLGWEILLTVLAGVGLHVISIYLPKTIQHKYGDLFHAAIVLLVGGAIAYFVEHWLKGTATDLLGARRATSIRFLARLVLYLAIALALLAAFGVGLSSVVFGSAFLTVILGLAGQNFFANLIAGMGLILFHPFEVGDRISFVASQYSMLVPSFPHDKMKPAYTGTVRDINLAYTTLDTDDNIPMVVPNGIMMQASIENHRQEERVPFHIRFDLDLSLNPTELLPQLRDQLQKLPYDVGVKLADVGPASFSLALNGIAANRREEDVRHDILECLIPLVQELRGTESSPS